MLPRLNGWERLYVVVSIIYLFVLAILVSSDFPRADDYAGQRLKESTKLVNQYLQHQGKNNKLGLTANQILFGDQQLLAQLHREFNDSGFLQSRKRVP